MLVSLPGAAEGRWPAGAVLTAMGHKHMSKHSFDWPPQLRLIMNELIDSTVREMNTAFFCTRPILNALQNSTSESGAGAPGK